MEHIIIVDEPKSRASAEEAEKWFDETVKARCIDNNVKPIFILSRLHKPESTKQCTM